jgi:hypothetical protein
MSMRTLHQEIPLGGQDMFFVLLTNFGKLVTHRVIQQMPSHFLTGCLEDPSVKDLPGLEFQC